MKLLRVIPLAFVVTLTSAAFADTPKKGAPAHAPKTDAKVPPKKDAKAPAKKTSAKDTKDPAVK